MPQNVVNLLDENTANRIAAGEVIERPSSVVKELVENAIDAGATRIEVELEEGGKRRIVIRDNGCGMSREDAVLALQRHATSKIRSADDLFAIRTLGFRGEALPSIASVSDFRVVTKTADGDATELRVHGGDIEAIDDVSAPDGTTITVENLFFNVPARLKFLKTTQTELNQTIDLIHRLMLAYPRLSFRLTHNGQDVVTYPGGADPLFAIAAVWGRDVARDMVPLKYVSPSLTVRGFVSKPSTTRASRSAQAMFVNGRYVRSRTMGHAFDSAFKQLMTTDRHPVLALFLDIAPELVDVNVHPTKIEVRFSREGDVYSAVHRAVQDALLTGGLMPEVNVQVSLGGLQTPAECGELNAGNSDTTGGREDAEPGRGAESAGSLVLPTMPESESGRILLPPKSVLSSWSQTTVNLPDAEARTQDPISPTLATHSLVGVPALSRKRERTGRRDGVPGDFLQNSPTCAMGPCDTSLPSYIGFDGYRIGRLRVLGQSRNTYIVAETEDALLLIDQHIAHERVLYEQMMNAANGEALSPTARSQVICSATHRAGVVMQHLALPQTLELGLREAKIVGERLAALQQAGFLLEPFGGETFVVRAVPGVIADKDYLNVLREIIEELTAESLSQRLLVPHEKAIIMASCKMAVKKGDPLTMDEMTRLLTDLAAMKNPFTCPHGRPILLALTHREMDRKFHRI